MRDSIMLWGIAWGTTWEIHWELMGTLWEHQNFKNKKSQTLFFKYIILKIHPIGIMIYLVGSL